MLKAIKSTLYMFIVITGLTAIVTLIAIGMIWFSPNYTEPPYLKWMIGAVILEIFAVVSLLAKKGLKYLPETVTDKERSETLKFMEHFISIGTSATIVSNRVSWLSTNQQLIDTLMKKIELGTKIEIITPKPVSDELRKTLNGATFIVTNEQFPPEARFTLVNADRSGAEKLAIARGVHPEHEITIFDNNSGPQIIAMAKDIIRKSRGLSDDK